MSCARRWCARRVGDGWPAGGVVGSLADADFEIVLILGMPGLRRLEGKPKLVRNLISKFAFGAD